MIVVISVLLLLLVLSIVLIRRITKINDYFHGKPIPSMAAKPLLGSTGPLTLKQCTISGFIHQVYNAFPTTKVFGLFDAITPIFVLRDPDLIKKITVKDFDHFIDHRPTFGNSNNDSPYVLFGKTLLSLTGQKWRDMRATLSPAFTGSKMRQMFDLVIGCCDSVTTYQLEHANPALEVDLRDLFTRTVTDLIASCTFGLQLDSFRNRDNEFYTNGKKMMRFERLSVALRFFANKLFPTLVGKLGIDVIDQEQNKYFSTLIMNAIKDRQTKGTVRNDMIHLLMLARQGLLRQQHEEEMEDEGFATARKFDLSKRIVSAGMTDSELIAQALIFFLAGFDTTSTSLLFLTYSLTTHPEIQQKLFEEIQETEQALNGNPLNYDTLQEMKYMDMVISESMRIRPAAAFLDRVCVRDYVLDDGEGLRFTMEEGTAVWIPSQGLHMDPKYFPDPTRFDPERFSVENRANISPFIYHPFGVGPRICIGSRFALMMVKAIMYYLLKHFSFEQSNKTPIPLKLRKGFTVVTAEGEVFITMKKRN